MTDKRTTLLVAGVGALAAVIGGVSGKLVDYYVHRSAEPRNAWVDYLNMSARADSAEDRAIIASRNRLLLAGPSESLQRQAEAFRAKARFWEIHPGRNDSAYQRKCNCKTESDASRLPVIRTAEMFHSLRKEFRPGDEVPLETIITILCPSATWCHDGCYVSHLGVCK